MTKHVLTSNAVVLAFMACSCEGTLYDDMSALPIEEGEEGGSEGGTGSATQGPPGSITIDTSPTDPFVIDYPETHTLSGFVRAGSGVGSLSVGGSNVTVGSDGAFSTQVPVAAGMQIVDIVATDSAELPSTRQGHTSLLVSDFRPDDEMNTSAITLALTEEILAMIEEPAREMIAEFDIEGMLAGSGAMDMDMCTFNILSATHGEPELDIYVDGTGQLAIDFTISNIRVAFTTNCNFFITAVNANGNVTTDFLFHTTLLATPNGGCVDGIETAPPDVTLPGFNVQITSGGSGFIDMILPLAVGLFEGGIQDMIVEEVIAQSDELLGDELAGLDMFNMDEEIDMMGVQANLSLCLAGLVNEGGVTRALMAAIVTADGAHSAPGIPYLPTSFPPPQPNTLFLDSGFVGQLMFAGWSSGVFSQENVGEIPVSVISLLLPEIEEAFPNAQTVTISIDGELPPLITASEPGQGDLRADIGNLNVLLSIDGELVFRVVIHLSLTLELVPNGSTIVPEVGNVEATIIVAEEHGVDVDDSMLVLAVNAQLNGMVSDLLGGVAIEVPLEGLEFNLLDVEPFTETNYVGITFE